MSKNRQKIDMPVVQPIQYDTKKYNIFKRFIRWVVYTRQWRVMEDYYFVLPDGVKIKIPKFFEFDGASIPKPLRGLLSPVGVLFIAGLFHDFSFRYNMLIGVKIGDNDIEEEYEYKKGAGKVYWNNLFKKVADQTNGLRYINAIATFMLSIFGFMAWNEHRRKIPKLSLD